VKEGAEICDASCAIAEDAETYKGVGGIESFVEKKSD
jgi:hypothetical protein